MHRRVCGVTGVLIGAWLLFFGLFVRSEWSRACTIRICCRCCCRRRRLWTAVL